MNELDENYRNLAATILEIAIRDFKLSYKAYKFRPNRANKVRLDFDTYCITKGQCDTFSCVLLDTSGEELVQIIKREVDPKSG